MSEIIPNPGEIPPKPAEVPKVQPKKETVRSPLPTPPKQAFKANCDDQVVELNPSVGVRLQAILCRVVAKGMSHGVNEFHLDVLKRQHGIPFSLGEEAPRRRPH